MDNNFSLKDNSETLFNIIKKQNKDLVLKEDSNHVRNIVKRATYKNIDCYVKIGFTESMKNLFSFTNNDLKPKEFNIPKYLLKGEFTYSDISFSYIIIQKVPGISLYNNQRFDLVSNRIVDIVNEITNFPNLNLPRTKDFERGFVSEKGKKQYQRKILDRLNEYYENSEYKYSEVFSKIKILFKCLMDSGEYQLSTVHGELNFHHIFTDENEEIWIIDWERCSQAYPYYYDLAEYIARLMVSVKEGINISKTIVKRISIREKTNLDTFKFCFYHRLLGTLWEMSDRGEKIYIDCSDEDEIVSVIEGVEIVQP